MEAGRASDAKEIDREASGINVKAMGAGETKNKSDLEGLPPSAWTRTASTGGCACRHLGVAFL